MKRAILVLFIAIIPLISGCITITTEDITREIKVISNPPKAKIEVNNDYIGETPCSISVREQTILFEGTYRKDLFIVAIPVYEGQCKQIKYIRSSDDLPKTIFFEMGLCNKGTDINLNINK